MKSFTYHIADENGLHARPAGQLAAFAKQFESTVKVTANEKQANGKRLLSLMTLGAVHGTTLFFEIEGQDEESAAIKLEQFCKNGMKTEKNITEGKE